MEMHWSKAQLNAILYALTAAVLFGASTPVAKILLGSLNPVLLAGLLYLGSGVGLAAWQILNSKFRKGPPPESRLKQGDFLWLSAAIAAGGVAGPILLMLGLRLMPASSASLFLNLEGVLTATLAWFVFKEHFDRRLVLGMAAITAGGIVLAMQDTTSGGLNLGVVAIAGACLAWAIDNNLTRKISAGDPIEIAKLKGLIAGVVNSALAFTAGASIPAAGAVVSACLVGLAGYGISLSLFVLALRHIGAARTSAYFSLSPFVGSLLSVVFLKDAATPYFLGAAGLMAIGTWLHVSEHHEHEHAHQPFVHEHSHVHDQHHQHEHDRGASDPEPHSHRHRHEPIIHSHPHYPDIHHHHEH